VQQTELDAFRQQLSEKVRGEVKFDEVTLAVYATDASIYQIMPPAVVFPRDEADVLAAIATAAEHGVPVLPRGGGTSLGGQAVGAAMVLDFTKHMKDVIELNVEERWVRVQPGVILDELNAQLAPHGLQFGPDPATSSRAAIGGMMGNNSSGTKSIVFGIMVDHVISSRVALSDGAVLSFEELSADEYARRCEGGGGSAREAEVLGGFKRIIDANRDQIDKRFPKVMRRVQGYNLDRFGQAGGWNLSKLIVGSEGTLGVILEAKLNLVPVPKCKALCAVHFAELLEAVRTVAPILDHGPSAVEIMDADVIGRARENPSISKLAGFIEGDPQAILIVEFFGETPEEVSGKVEKLAAELRSKSLGYAWPAITDPARQAEVWQIRKGGLGLLLGMKGNRKPTAFIEDCCLPVEHLPEYIDQMSQFCKGRGVEMAMYAHASVGVIHVRPILDLRLQEDIDHMKAIAEHAMSLVRQYGGAWSGEHGDGRVRSPLLERFLGPEIYAAFKDVKRLFDPAGLMNPGVIVDTNPMDQDLRYGTNYRVGQIETVYHYREDLSFAGAVEMCSGVGACRQTLIGTMCPSYRLTGDEQHSTRGRANILRLAMTGQLGEAGLTGPAVAEVLDLCLSCKACKSECPSNVDMARLKGEVMQKHHDTHGVSLRERLVAKSTKMARLMSGWPAPMMNWFQKTKLFRWVLEKVAGFDRRRTPPAYARQTLTKWFDSRPKGEGSGERPKVVLFDDTYMTYHQTEVGVSAVELLESCGYEVVLARAGCCQRPRISHGFLRDAKRDGTETLRNLDVYARQGLPIVVCEPGCASALSDDLPDLVDDAELGRRIKDSVMMIDVFLAREVEAGRLDCAFTSPYSRILIHGHCHQKSLYGTAAMKGLLDRVEGTEVAEIDSGCCGMAGSFGYEVEHYEQSLAVGEEVLFPAIRERAKGTAVVACGFSCRHQIADATGVKPLHWVQTIRGETNGQG